MSQFSSETVRVLKEIAGDECSVCRRGDPCSYRPHYKRFFHRLPDGTRGNMIWVPCRATAIWNKLRDPSEGVHKGDKVTLVMSGSGYEELMAYLGSLLCYTYDEEKLRRFIHGLALPGAPPKEGQ